jgi:hypothetical protein
VQATQSVKGIHFDFVVSSVERAIACCFGILQPSGYDFLDVETPFDDPMIGQNAIYRYWSKASQALKDVQFSYEILAVQGNLGIALWQGKFVSVKSGNHVALDGVFLVEFDEQEKCSTFREWWHRQEIDASPFDGT